MADNTAEVQVDTEISTVDDAVWGYKGGGEKIHACGCHTCFNFNNVLLVLVLSRMGGWILLINM